MFYRADVFSLNIIMTKNRKDVSLPSRCVLLLVEEVDMLINDKFSPSRKVDSNGHAYYKNVAKTKDGLITIWLPAGFKKLFKIEAR